MYALLRSKTPKFIVAVCALCIFGSLPAHADDWSKSVVSLIGKNQSYPRSAQVRKEEGVTKVSLSIEADGNISNIEVTQSSGSDILDRESQKIFEKIGKFPPPPAGATKIVVPISWKLS